MAESVKEVMTPDPRTVDKDATIQDAAREMRDADAGAVLVSEGGIVTDRDIAVRAVAEGRGPDTPVDEVATKGVQALSPDDSVDDAAKLMREHNVRRAPVVEDDRPVGIVSLGDLAEER